MVGGIEVPKMGDFRTLARRWQGWFVSTGCVRLALRLFFIRTRSMGMLKSENEVVVLEVFYDSALVVASRAFQHDFSPFVSLFSDLCGT